MKEKKEMNVEFKSTMEAIVNTLKAAHLSKDSENPQVFEVRFKLPGEGYSSRSDFYRLTFDPNHLDSLGFAGDSLFLYKGEGIFDKLMGLVDVQKNGKAIIVRDYWFDQKMTKTLRDEDMEFVKIIHYDANVPEAYKQDVDHAIAELEEENLPF